MKTYLLTFAFIPAILVFMANGPGGMDYVLLTLLLIALAVDGLGALAKFHADLSETEIIDGYHLDVLRAWKSGNQRKAGEKLAALELFETRGAA